jgi:hypothetical protein
VSAYTNYKQMFAAEAHPQSRISIHRCYKRCWAGAMRVDETGGFRGGGTGLCKILHVNFREFLFHDVGE